jgi:hypothetical protein
MSKSPNVSDMAYLLIARSFSLLFLLKLKVWLNILRSTSDLKVKVNHSRLIKDLKNVSLEDYECLHELSN